MEEKLLDRLKALVLALAIIMLFLIELDFRYRMTAAVITPEGHTEFYSYGQLDWSRMDLRYYHFYYCLPSSKK